MVVECMRDVLLVQTGDNDSADLSKEALHELSFLASQVSQERLLRALRLFSQASLKHDQPSPLPLELAAVELALEPAPTVAEVVAVPPPAAARPAPASINADPRPMPPRRPVAPAPPPDAVARPPQVSEGPAAQGLDAQWPVIVKSMSRYKGKRFDIGALLRSSNAHYLDGSTLVVRFSHRSHVERLQDELDEPRCRQAVGELLERALGGPYTIRVEADENGARGPAAQPQGHLVRAALNMGGKVVPERPDAELPEPAVEGTLDE